jgi:exosortase
MNIGFVTPPTPALRENARKLRISELCGIALIVVLTGALFGSVLVDMANDWWNVPALSQGMLIPPLAFYVAWLSRERVLAMPRQFAWAGVLISAGACGLLILGKLASEFFLMRISFVILITGVVWTFWGALRTKKLAFPLLLLATMVPLPALVYNTLSAPLQLFASDFATRIAQALGTSVYRDGNVIYLAQMSLGVAEACSGLNSLSALVVGSLLVGYLFCSGVVGRTLLCVVSIPFAIGLNVLRVAGTAILADYNQNFALGFYHSFSGWLVFVAGFGLLYISARLIHAIVERSATS